MTSFFMPTAAAALLRFGCAAALLAVLSFVNPAHGAMTTFAQFDESTHAGTEPFTFTNGSPTSTFGGTVLGNFTFLIAGLSAAPQVATITLASTAVTPATSAGPVLSQPINGPTNTLKFIRVSDNANLLTVTFTGNITGLNGDNTATLSANTTSGDTATYTSDFLNFSGTTARSFGLTAALDPGFTQNANGFLDTFTADLTGGFSSSPAPTVVPEPATAAVMILGAAGLLSGRRKRRAIVA